MLEKGKVPPEWFMRPEISKIIVDAIKKSNEEKHDFFILQMDTPGGLMNSMRENFIEGARQKKIPEKSAIQVYNLMEQFAQYGFNKSHATAYALLAYQTAYLKAYFPVQFMAALLTSEIGNTDKIVMYIAECKDMGIPVLPPDINESELEFHSAEGRIRFGMLAIRNVGEGAR